MIKKNGIVRGLRARWISRREEGKAVAAKCAAAVVRAIKRRRKVS